MLKHRNPNRIIVGAKVGKSEMRSAESGNGCHVVHGCGGARLAGLSGDGSPPERSDRSGFSWRRRSQAELEQLK